MRNFHNIEKSGFNSSYKYVGYSNGRIFHIRRGFEHGWKAIECGGNSAVLYSRTLTGLSALLEQLDPNSPIASAQRQQAMDAANVYCVRP